MRQGLCVTALLLATIATAQTHSSSVPSPAASEQTGSVTGHVFCADTNQPARFAHVSLEAIADPSQKPPASVPSATKPERPSHPSMPAGGTTVETNLDGSFTLSKVKPGSYHVIVDKEGYITARDIFTTKQMEDPSPDMKALVAEALPHVVVSANQSDRAEIRLERGAAVSGTILYDDGSPAGEIRLKLLHKDVNGKWVSLSSDNARMKLSSSSMQTDDRGYFRIASLLADEYMLEADLSLADSKASIAGTGDNQIFFVVSSYNFSLPFYGSGTAHLSEAASFKVRAGQELPGVDMTIPISKLHKLSGRVIAGSDGHVVNAATLSLVTRDDNKEVSSSDISREDGLFHFEFVPEGDYLLKVSNARDVVWEPDTTPNTLPLPKPDKERVLRSYGGVEQTILLSGDMLGVIATIPSDAKPSTPPSQ